VIVFLGGDDDDVFVFVVERGGVREVRERVAATIDDATRDEGRREGAARAPPNARRF